MSFKRKAAAQGAENKGSNETLEKQEREQNTVSHLSQAPGEEENENGAVEEVPLSDHDEKNQIRSITPEVDPDKLANFDHSKKISTLIKIEKQEVALEECSKPVREVMKVNYGVAYNESL